MKDKEAQAVEDVIEQDVIEKKLRDAKQKADKTKILPADKKKGQKVAFVPASRLPKLKAPEGYVPAWKANTPENIRRLQIEGWEIANRLEHKMDIEMGNYYRKINDKPVSNKETTIVHNEMIAMLLPVEMAEARKEYYREESSNLLKTKLRPEDEISGFMKRANIKTNIKID